MRLEKLNVLTGMRDFILSQIQMPTISDIEYNAPYSTAIMLSPHLECPQYIMQMRYTYEILIHVAEIYLFMAATASFPLILFYLFSLLFSKETTSVVENTENYSTDQVEPNIILEREKLIQAIRHVLLQGNKTARELFLELKNTYPSITKQEINRLLYRLKVNSITTYTQGVKKAPVWSLVQPLRATRRFK